MSRTQFQRDGRILYRTAALTFTQARAFAECLTHNARFADVDVARSTRASSDRCFFVTFSPSNPARVQDLAEHEQEKRTGRAEVEGDAYAFWPDPDTCGLVWCLSTSGEVYELTAQGGIFRECNCPDRLYRGRHCGIACKHMQAGNRRLYGAQCLCAGCYKPLSACSCYVADEDAEWRRVVAMLEAAQDAQADLTHVSDVLPAVIEQITAVAPLNDEQRRLRDRWITDGRDEETFEEWCDRVEQCVATGGKAL